MQHAGFNAPVCGGEHRADAVPAQEDKLEDEFPDYFFFNLSGFPAEVVHSSPTTPSFAKRLPTS